VQELFKDVERVAEGKARQNREGYKHARRRVTAVPPILIVLLDRDWPVDRAEMVIS
jgi:hypothetical protein